MNTEAQSPSISDVKKFLKDADSYDPMATENEMLELYQVLKDSEKTANEENEQRRIFEQTEANCSMIEELRKNSVPVHPEKQDLESIDNEATANCNDVVCSGSSSEEDVKTAKNKGKPFTPRKWSYQKKQAQPLSDIENQISSTSIPTRHFQQKQNEKEKEVEDEEEDVDVVDVIDVFNCVPTTHKPLKRIALSPKYSPPFYCTSKITSLDYKQRALVISNYHLDLLQKYNNYQRQSIFPAPWGKAIQTNTRFNGSLTRKIEISEENPELSQENVGTDEFSEAVKEYKSSDEDFEVYVSKSGRQTKRKLYMEQVDNNANEWKKRSKPTSSDDDTKKPNAKKRRGIGSLSKDEIIKRSRLLGDNSNTNSTRSNKLFEKLVEDGRKKKDAEKEMEKVNAILEQISGDEDSSDAADLINSEEPYIRRRVIPPSLAKKHGSAGRGKSTGRAKGPKKNSGNKKSSTESSSQDTSSQKYDPLEVSVTSSDTKGTAACPVCFEQFFQSELIEHTPFCLDSSSQNSVSTKSLDFCQSRITCETCDKVFSLDMNYEDHVQQCIKQQLK